MADTPQAYAQGHTQDQKSTLMAEMGLAKSVAGFVASDPDAAELAPLAAQVLADPIALHKLCDRVFELLRSDLRRQQERNRGYGR